MPPGHPRSRARGGGGIQGPWAEAEMGIPGVSSLVTGLGPSDGWGGAEYPESLSVILLNRRHLLYGGFHQKQVLLLKLLDV